jgi:hypothetical protein
LLVIAPYAERSPIEFCWWLTIGLGEPRWRDVSQPIEITVGGVHRWHWPMQGSTLDRQPQLRVLTQELFLLSSDVFPVPLTKRYASQPIREFHRRITTNLR